MAALKRMALAFGCMLLAIVVLGLIITVPFAIRHGRMELLPPMDVLLVYALFASPGWVLALPFIFFFKDADGWRGWATLSIGTAIGPCFMAAWTLLASRGWAGWSWRAERGGIVLSLVIGFVTTALYVLLLRRSSLSTN